MYKIFIDSSDNELIRNLSNKTRNNLISHDNCIVYGGDSNAKYDISITNLELNAYVYIQENAQGSGPEILLEGKNRLSNGIGKEVYKGIQKIYNNNNVDKGLIYKDGIFKIPLDNVPSILINVIDIKNSDDVKWLSENTDNVAQAISNGIIAGFNLKHC